MTALWTNDGSGWRLLSPAGFPDEAALQSLIEQAPQILPLAGSPRLAIVGREVMLGNGFADLLAVEPSGRIAVIEVKLARNSEARRAIVAQVLTYAAYLDGLDPATLEHDILGRHLRERGHDNLMAAAANDQEGSFEAEAFAEGLAGCLSEGRFRIVLVLDEAPEELVRLVGYLESITSDKLLIDLITVASYRVGGSEVIVPRRVDAERRPAGPTPTQPRATTTGLLVDGVEDFDASIASASEEQQSALKRLRDWAVELHDDGLVRLQTFHSRKPGLLTLLPRLHGGRPGLVSIYNNGGRASITVARSVFERWAAAHIPIIEGLIDPVPLGQGTMVHKISDELLEALAAAYRESASGA